MTHMPGLRANLFQGFGPVQESRPIVRSSRFEELDSPAALTTIVQAQSLPAVMVDQPEPRQQAMPPFSDQFPSTIAIFPRVGRVVQNEYGVFVPRSIFGAEANLVVREETVSDRTFRITVFGLLNQQQMSTPATNCLLEVRWLRDHQHEFRGEWVALDGTQLIAHAKQGREVFEAARNAGVKTPFVVRIPTADEDLPFGGW